ncbi:hypothetical protein J2W83_002098 [Pseudomonas hunanensis]|uniref:Uncharacterized protein n=1 Tax=Pseudomonas hunanensis TaxID=1247546 RepID=A0ACC6K253_9PSED|nr:hypothetical protein [Pseudomonas hunanensis]
MAIVPLTIIGGLAFDLSGYKATFEPDQINKRRPL